MTMDTEKKLFQAFEITSITHGTMVSQRQDNPWVTKVCVDSRFVTKASLFIALPGERTDGHAYLKKAVALGATCLIISDNKRYLYERLHLDATNVAVISVSDTFKALRALAENWVARFPRLVRVAVTGSSGKTTSKEMISSILSTMGPTVKNPGNYNSDIGLPLSVFNIDDTHEFGVFEMGTNHQGEIQRMLDVYSPDVSLMTNIGTAHIGLFGSQEAIVREKSNIFHDQVKQGYIGEENIWRNYIKQAKNIDLTPFGMRSTVGYAGAQSLGLNGWNLNFDGSDIHVKLIGSHNLQNALGAISVAQGFGATKEQIKAGLEGLEPISGRSRVIDGKVTVIEDSYNSNVESARQIIDYVKELPWNGRKNVVLGSMKELGFASSYAHRLIGKRVAELAPEGTFLYGKEMEAAYKMLKDENYSRTLFFTDEYEELEQQVTSYVESGDLVLLKGSRAMAMERLISPLSLVS